MRIVPHTLYKHVNEDDFYRRVLQDSISTHGHPRAIIGSLVFSAALYWLTRSQGALGYGDLIEFAEQGLLSFSDLREDLPSDWIPKSEVEAYQTEWNNVLLETRRLLELAKNSLTKGAMASSEKLLEQLGAIDSSVSGAGNVTAVSAIYIASRNAVRPIAGLIESAYLREADTDTLASMAGSLLGLINGTTWLGQLREVQDADYLISLATSLAEGRVLESPHSQASASARRLRELRFRLFDTGYSSTGKFPDGRSYEVMSRLTLEPTRSDYRGRRIVLKLDDGQVVIIDDVRKERSGVTAAQRSASLAQPDSTARASAGQLIPDSDLGKITLYTSDLSASLTFYRNLLGIELAIEPESRSINISPRLTLQEFDTKEPVVGSSIALEFHIRNVDSIGRNFARQVSRDAHGRATVQLRDPDGRLIVVRANSE